MIRRFPLFWYTTAALYNMWPKGLLAQTFQGGQVEDGLDLAAQIRTGGGGLTVRATALNILYTVLSYLAILAVVVLVIVSIALIVSLGNDEARQKLQKVFIYVAVGFIVIILAAGFVNFVIESGIIGRTT